MTGPVILDTGPLVAALDSSESHHEWVVAQLKTIRTPLVTCEAVIVEACHIVRSSRRAVAEIGQFIAGGMIACWPVLPDASGRVFDLMRKYRDLPMSLADACLVHLVEQQPGSAVLTLDAHFRIYRQRNRRVIRTVGPW